MLFNMFKIFFNYSMTPSVWLKSTIAPEGAYHDVIAYFIDVPAPTP